MPAYRFPILVWEDFQGRFTACLIEGPEPGLAAVGDTPGEAADRVREYLQWRYRDRSWLAEPDFLEPELVFVRVDVRPEYQVEKRRFPASETLPLRVACVRGKDANGLLLCAMPLLDARFNYYEPAAFKGLVTHYVQSLLEGMTPRQLSRLLPPRSVALDDVVVQVPRAERSRRDEVKVESLAEVAEPVATSARGNRRRVRAWERDAEVAQLAQVLRRERASVLLVGESGVGKSTLLAEAVRKVERERAKPSRTPDERESLRTHHPEEAAEASDDDLAARAPGGHRFWLTGASRLIAGMQYLGQWQERCEAIIAETSLFNGVLCVENLLDLVRTGAREPAAGLAGFLLPYLQRGELRMVAEATPAELDACRRLLPGFADVFQVFAIPPFTRAQAIAALDGLAGALSQNLKVERERGTVEQVYRLFARFLPYLSFPGRASAFVSDLFDRALREKPASDVRSVTPHAAVTHFVRRTGLPELLLRDDVRLDHAHVYDHFRREVIGQDAACRATADLVTTFKAGLNDPNRPVGVLLFAGPTGVGKTELAKALSRYLFGHGEEADRLIRLDMSEYAGPGAAARLTGDADGGEPSELIRRIRQQPFAVVLLDEIEKAAPEVFDVLLGVLDEGRLTDRFGRLSTFRSAILVMTSNLGATATEPIGLGRQTAPDYHSEVMGFFRPEFFNRIDAVVTFEPLSNDTVRAIAEKELAALGRREGLTRAGLKLTWSNAVVTRLAEQGYDRRYGARPLQRTVESLVVTPLARFLTERPDLRDASIHLGLDGAGAVTFSVMPKALMNDDRESRHA